MVVRPAAGSGLVGQAARADRAVLVKQSTPITPSPRYSPASGRTQPPPCRGRRLTSAQTQHAAPAALIGAGQPTRPPPAPSRETSRRSGSSTPHRAALVLARAAGAAVAAGKGGRGGAPGGPGG